MGVKVRQKDGKWYVFINHKGKRKAKCIGASKRAAEEVKRKLEAKLTLGDMGWLDQPHRVVTFADYTQHWLDTYVSVACKSSSQRAVRSIVENQLLPAFGTQDLQSITRAQVRTFLAQTHQRYALNYVKAIMRTLHTIFSQAVEEEVLAHNPTVRVGKYLPEKHRKPDQEINPFTSVELARYLAAMQTSYPQYYPYFLCLARTGMREGEALGLFWDDFQFGADPHDAHRFIHVRRTYDVVHHTYNTPKNGRSRRVDMSQELRAALLNLQQQRFDEAVMHGMTTLPPVVFCGPDGRPITPTRVYRIHQRVCTLAGLRRTRVHDLRHYLAPRVMPSKEPSHGGSLALQPKRLGIISVL
jgi:integrase